MEKELKQFANWLDNRVHDIPDGSFERLVGEYLKERLGDIVFLPPHTDPIFRHMPKTVLGGKVELNERLYLKDVMELFNSVRAIYKNKPSNIRPDAKACRQIVELCRSGIARENVEETLFNMFEEPYHKENNWRHITPEFMSRIDKFQKYGE